MVIVLRFAFRLGIHIANVNLCFPVCQSWGRRERAVFVDLCSSIHRQTAVYEKSTVGPR